MERRAEVPRAAVAVTPDDLDPLTGGLRWERFQFMLAAEQAQASGVLLAIDLTTRSDQALAATGQTVDDILPWMAKAISQAIRRDDLLSHLEGFRFAVLLRGAPQDMAAAISERILESVDDTIFLTKDGIVHLDVSVGGAVYAQSLERDGLGKAMLNLDVARESPRGILVQ
jgi:GGDEF domain-containing protein